MLLNLGARDAVTQCHPESPLLVPLGITLLRSGRRAMALTPFVARYGIQYVRLPPEPNGAANASCPLLCSLDRPRFLRCCPEQTASGAQGSLAGQSGHRGLPATA